MSLLSACEACSRSAVGLAEDAEFVLDVVADLVRDDIGGGEVAARAETLRESREEVGVEVDLLVARAVERPGLGGRTAAGRLRGALEEHKRRGRVSATKFVLEDIGPDLFGVGQRDRDELCGLLVGLGDLAAAGLNLAAGHAALQDGHRVAAQSPDNQGHCDETEATASNDATGADTPAVFDIVAAATSFPLHRKPPWPLGPPIIAKSLSDPEVRRKALTA
jgi:hypothetical protein